MENENEQTQTAEKTETSENFDVRGALESLQKSIDERFSGIEGRLQRTVKKEKKAEVTDEKQDKQTGNSDLLERFDKLSLRSADITDEDEIALAKDFKKRTGQEMDEVVTDDIFLARLEKLRTSKANEKATSNVKGDRGGSNIKNDPGYWQALGRPPSAEEVPDRKTRATIARSFMDSTKNGKKFYSD